MENDKNSKYDALPELSKKLVDFNMAHTLLWMELVLALHDEKILLKPIMADRLLRLSQRTDIEMSDSARRFIALNAEGLADLDDSDDDRATEAPNA